MGTLNSTQVTVDFNCGNGEQECDCLFIEGGFLVYRASDFEDSISLSNSVTEVKDWVSHYMQIHYGCQVSGVQINVK